MDISKHRTDIDGLRSIAIIPVVLFHAGIGGFSGGFVGVDIFFVISGYLITGLIWRDAAQLEFSIVRFYERRIRRIFPALFAVIALLAVVAPLVLLPQDLMDLGKSIIATAAFGSNILFWRQSGYFDSPAGEKFLLHTWSLAVEEQFYILFPLAFAWLVGCRRRETVVWSLTGVAGLSLATCIYLTYRHPIAAFYLPIARTWELLLGAIVAITSFPWALNRAVNEISALIGIALIALAVFMLDSGTPFPGYAAMLPCMGTAMILQAGSKSATAVGRVLSAPPLAFIGLISYSLYLWHWPLIVFFRYTQLRSPSGIEGWILVAISLVLAWLSWKYIETPIRSRVISPESTSLFKGATVLVTASLCFGIAVLAGQGWPQRLPKDVIAMLQESSVGISRYFSACTEPSVEDVAAGNLCRLGSSANLHASSFILWGDSHAAALANAVDAEARRHHSIGVSATRLGCPPILGVNRMDQPELQCAAFNQTVLNYVNRSGIKSVLLGGQWALYAEGLYYKVKETHPVVISNQGYQYNRLTFVEGLDRTFGALQKMGVRVFVIADVPEVGTNVPSAMAKARLWNQALMAGPTRTDYLQRQSFVFNTLNSLQNKYNFNVLFPALQLCTSGICEIAYNGRALYRDDNHLSHFGALGISGLFAPVFENTVEPVPTLQALLRDFS